MPVRIEPDGLRLIAWDEDARQWVALHTPGIGALALLDQYVEVRPDTTLRDIFKIVGRDPQLCSFLTDYCSCRIASLLLRSEVDDIAPDVPAIVEGEDGQYTVDEKPVSNRQAAFISICREMFVIERGDGRREICIHTECWLSSREDPTSGSSMPHELRTQDTIPTYLLDCQLRLDPEVRLDIDLKTGDLGSIETVEMRFRLLDLFKVLFSQFGQPIFDERYQEEVDEYEDALRRIRERFRNPPEDTGGTLPG